MGPDCQSFLGTRRIAGRAQLHSVHARKEIALHGDAAGGSPRNSAAEIVEILQAWSALRREENIYQIGDALRASPLVRAKRIAANASTREAQLRYGSPTHQK